MIIIIGNNIFSVSIWVPVPTPYHPEEDVCTHRIRFGYHHYYHTNIELCSLCTEYCLSLRFIIGFSLHCMESTLKIFSSDIFAVLNMCIIKCNRVL